MDRVESALERLQWCWERYSSAGAGSRDGAEVLGAVQSLRRTTELLPSALLVPAAALLFSGAHAASLTAFVAATLQPAGALTAPGWAGVVQRARATALELACAAVQQLVARTHGPADAESCGGSSSRDCVRALCASFAALRGMALAVLRGDTAAANRVLALDILDTLYGARLPLAADASEEGTSSAILEGDDDDGEEEDDDVNKEKEEEEEEDGGADTPGADRALVCATADVVADMCAGGGKLAQGVRAQCMRLLGTLAAHFPRLMRSRVPRVLLDILVPTLDAQFRAAKPELQVIAGALTALRAVLRHPLAVALVTEAPEPGTSSKLPRTAAASETEIAPQQQQQQQQGLRQTLFVFIELGIEPPAHLARYDVPRAALRLLAAHAGLFRDALCADHARVAAALAPLCVHANRPLRHAALDAQDAFLQELAAAPAAAARDCFGALLRRFYAALEARTSTAAAVAAAVRGLGALAGMAARCLSTADLGRVLDRLHCLADPPPSSSDGSDGDDRPVHTARAASAYARLAAQLPVVDDRRVAQLEALVAALFRSYALLPAAQRFAHEHALVLVLRALEGRGAALRTLLDRAVVPALALSCCPAPHAAAYAPLWLAALRGRGPAGLTLRADTRAAVHSAVVRGALALLDMLDLRYVVSKSGGRSSSDDDNGGETTAVATAPLAALVPVVPKDMDIFLNLVELLRVMLLQNSGGGDTLLGSWTGVL